VQYHAELRGAIGGIHVTAELRRATVRDDDPAVAERNLRRVTQHLAETIGYNVVDITVGHLAEAFLVIAGRPLHAAHGHHAIAVALQTVAGRAENVVAFFPAPEKLEVHGQREIVRVLWHEEFVVGNRSVCHSVFHQGALRTAIAKEFGRRKRPVFRLVGHVLPQVFATATENQGSNGASSSEAARGVSQGPPRRYGARELPREGARIPQDRISDPWIRCKQKNGLTMHALNDAR